MQEKRFSFITTKYKVIHIKNKKYKIVKKKKKEARIVKKCLYVRVIISDPLYIIRICSDEYAYSLLKIYFWCRSLCMLQYCCSVSLLFVGSANWMPARNVALPIDIGHCEMHSVLTILLIRITTHRTSHHKSKQLTHFCNQKKKTMTSLYKLSQICNMYCI